MQAKICNIIMATETEQQKKARLLKEKKARLKKAEEQIAADAAKKAALKARLAKTNVDLTKITNKDVTTKPKPKDKTPPKVSSGSRLAFGRGSLSSGQTKLQRKKGRKSYRA